MTSSSIPSGPTAGRQEYLERQPTYWLKRSYQALRRRVDNDLRPFGITLSQRDVLLNLFHSGPMPLRRLRDRLGLEQSSVSRLVDGLVRRGLVMVVEDTADRRSRIADLTGAGRAVISETPGAAQLAGSLLTAELSSDEVNQLIDLLRRCTVVLESAEPGSVGGQRLELSPSRATRPRRKNYAPQEDLP